MHKDRRDRQQQWTRDYVHKCHIRTKMFSIFNNSHPKVWWWISCVVNVSVPPDRGCCRSRRYLSAHGREVPHIDHDGPAGHHPQQVTDHVVFGAVPESVAKPRVVLQHRAGVNWGELGSHLTCSDRLWCVWLCEKTVHLGFRMTSNETTILSHSGSTAQVKCTRNSGHESPLSDL